MNPPRDHGDSRIHIEGLKPADIALLKAVAIEAAEQAVTQTLSKMGLDPSEPFDAQKDMMWLRATRERCEGAGAKALAASIGLLVVTAATMLWHGFTAQLPKWPPGAPHP